MTLLLRVIYWRKMSFVALLSDPSTPKLDNCLQYETYNFAHYIKNILDVPAMFVFCIVIDVVNEMQMSFSATTVLSYLPREQTLQICVQEI